MKSFLLFTLSLMLLLHKAGAQVCNGILGAPILNLTFGQGNATQSAYSPLSAYAPGMSSGTMFQAGGVLGAANTSALVKNASTFGPSPYWASSPDHTGDPYGLFMGLNMPDNTGVVVVEYIMNDLCPNTTLEYSIWLLNLMAPTNPTVGSSLLQYPNLIMRILDPANNLLAQQTTGNVPIDVLWHQYSMLFSNGSNTSVKLQLINNTAGSSYGNDLALDDITVRPCVPDASILPLLDTTLCSTTTLTFNAAITPGVYTLPTYQWQYSTNGGSSWTNAAATGSAFTFTFNTTAAPSEYRIRYLVAPQGVTASTNCHAVSNTTIVRIDTIGRNFLPNDTAICNGAPLVLQANAVHATGYTWSTGATTPAITINAPGVYWAEATTAMGCSATDTVHITLNNISSAELGADTTLCEGQALELAPAGIPGTTHYLWSTGSTASSIVVQETGTYWLRLSDDDCQSTDSITVTFAAIPEVDLGPDLKVCEAGSITLKNNTAYTGASYLWSTGSTTQELTTGEGTYWLSITNYPDCRASDTITITSHSCNCTLYLPNAFSPNGDGLNDEFYPLSQPCAYSAYSMQVYNRWGQRVFYTNNRGSKWDGTFHMQPAETGTYFYYIKLVETASGEAKHYKGDVILVR